MKSLFALLVFGLLFASLSFAAIVDITLVSPTEGQTVYDTTPTFSFIPSSDTDSGTLGNWCVLDVDGTYTGEFTASASNGTLTMLTDTSPAQSAGSHNWSIRCGDSTDSGPPGFSFTSIVGNYTVVSDSTSPSSSILYPTEGLNFSTNVSIELNFTASDAESGLDTCAYVLDNGPLQTISCIANTTFDVSSNVEGPHDIYLRVNDSAGNVGFSSTINFTIDMTAPTVNLMAPTNNTYTSNNSLDYFFNATDNVHSTMNCTLMPDGGTSYSNSSTLNNTATNISVTGVSEGTHSWFILCTDPAGNIGVPIQNYTYIRDATAPVISLIGPANNSMFAGSSIDLSFSFSQVDNLSSTSNCSLLLDGSSVASNS
ncbi:MAG: hypothetical protein ACP5N9_05695, partial [Candidatus Bilamarchaeum sp.]